MTGIEQVRLAIASHPKTTFTTLDLRGINNLSARMSDLVLLGELEIVGEIKIDKRKPFKVYKKTKVKPVTKTRYTAVSEEPIKGQTLRVVKWCEITSAWKETRHPSYDSIPPCPGLLELLVLMNEAYRAPTKIGFANRSDR